MKPTSAFQVVIHGSFSRHFQAIKHARHVFEAAKVEVMAPKASDITGLKDNFLLLEHEDHLDPRLVELRYLQAVRRLSQRGFSYVANPDGYIGPTVAYELAAAHFIGIPVYFWARPTDLPTYVPDGHILTPEQLTRYLLTHHQLPGPAVKASEVKLHALMTKLTSPTHAIAAGGIIEYRSKRANAYPEVLLVKTHKWGGRYSMVGGKLRRGERLADGLSREILEETGLQVSLGQHLCTFDEIEGSGYYEPAIRHIFVDYVTTAHSRQIQLNDEAQDHIWIPAEAALAELELEPNARHTLQLYVASLSASS